MLSIGMILKLTAGQYCVTKDPLEKGPLLNRLPQKFSRLITVVLIAGIVVSGIADAASQCCCTLPETRATSCDTAVAAGDAGCHPAPPACHAPQAAATEFPAAPAADDDRRDTCCQSDRCGTFKPAEFLRNPSPPPLLALATQVGTPDAGGVVGSAAAPEIRRGFPQTIPIYLLKNAILR